MTGMLEVVLDRPVGAVRIANVAVTWKVHAIFRSTRLLESRGVRRVMAWAGLGDSIEAGGLRD